jgi:hypothetical protein
MLYFVGFSPLSTPVENSSFCRLKIPQPSGGGGLQFQPEDGT